MIKFKFLFCTILIILTSSVIYSSSELDKFSKDEIEYIDSFKNRSLGENVVYYSKMVNLLDQRYLQGILSKNIKYESQTVSKPIFNQEVFSYLTNMIISIKENDEPLRYFIELGYSPYDNSPCMIVYIKENYTHSGGIPKRSWISVKNDKNNKINDILIQIVPDPNTIKGTKIFPGLDFNPLKTYTPKYKKLKNNRPYYVNLFFLNDDLSNDEEYLKLVVNYGFRKDKNSIITFFSSIKNYSDIINFNKRGYNIVSFPKLVIEQDGEILSMIDGNFDYNLLMSNILPSTGEWDGEWYNGKMNGYGVYTSYDGRKYTGRIENNYFQGKGEVIFPYNDIYIGNFKDGVYEGKGKYYFKSGRDNGDIYDGSHHRGYRHGEGTYFYKDGRKIKGIWKENKPFDGVYYNSKKEKIGQYTKGKYKKY